MDKAQIIGILKDISVFLELKGENSFKIRAYQSGARALERLEDNFDMYVSIAKYANNCLPIDIIQNDIFKEFRTKKKNFPKKFYYHF